MSSAGGIQLHRFLLTIHGTTRSLEMAVPADTPLHGVMASIVEAVEEAPAASPSDTERWRLALDDGRLLNPRASLVESGVHEGTELTSASSRPRKQLPSHRRRCPCTR